MDKYLANWKNDPEFVLLYEKFNNIHDLKNDFDHPIYARLYILRQLASQQSNKDGLFVECGIYAGMSMFFVADKCKTSFIGIDSFEGLSKPGEFDTDYFKEFSLSAPIYAAKKTLDGISNTTLYKGWIPEVFKSIEDNKYSYVNIDVDLYEPTKTSIEYFWPRMATGGVLICDDYGSPKTIGARKAMNDFFKRDQIIELPTGQAIVYKD